MPKKSKEKKETLKIREIDEREIKEIKTSSLDKQKEEIEEELQELDSFDSDFTPETGGGERSSIVLRSEAEQAENIERAVENAPSTSSAATGTEGETKVYNMPDYGANYSTKTDYSWEDRIISTTENREKVALRPTDFSWGEQRRQMSQAELIPAESQNVWTRHQARDEMDIQDKYRTLETKAGEKRIERRRRIG